MVVAAHPLAVEAGNEIVARGGSAVDAAIAVQFVLNIVEPQSSGIGGGAFLLHYDRRRQRLSTYDGRETAPRAATPERFLLPDGQPRTFGNAVFGGLSVGVPGAVRLMGEAHRAHGKLPWRELLAPALKIAREGFPISPRLHALLRGLGAEAFEATARQHYFDAGGAPHPTGHILRSPAFAETLERLAREGPDAFYAGPIAQAIVRAAKDAPNHAGDITLDDLAGYRVARRSALCVAYRQRRVCGMGPPSSGGIAVGQILKLVEPFDLGRQPLNPDALHLIAEAQKLAYADRDRYVGDPDHTTMPAGLTDPAYLKSRRTLISREAAMAKAEAGRPRDQRAMRPGVDTTREGAGTSHISIIDADGNAVAMTTTIENAFGSRIMAAGFLLNNQLTDFAFVPKDAAGQALANAVAPGKRPRSSMAPTIVLAPNGTVEIVTGSPGGSRIILYVAKTLIGIIDWRLSPQDAANLANFGSRNGPFEIETTVAGIMPGLEMSKRGHVVRHEEMTSGVHTIVRRPSGRLEAGIDPRREGMAAGR
jgi:gamma-glutamyltranspeptidase/glutathione hydrolase